MVVRSLGIHVPCGVSYLINEKILSEDSTSYSWHVFEDPDSPGVFDELVITTPHVIWSRGNRVHRAFSFTIEAEPVQQALFAVFARQETDQDFSSKLTVRKRRILTPKTPHSEAEAGAGADQAYAENAQNRAAGTGNSKTHDRALVVVLKSHMQIFYVGGGSSIVPLNFEVDKVFALSEGLLIQRKTSHTSTLQQSILPPKTPRNSFALSQSFVQSPDSATLPANAANPQVESLAVRSLFKSAKSDYDSLAQASMPAHYHLSDPFVDFGVIGNAKVSSGSGSGSGSEALLSPRERLVYVSAHSEARKQPGSQTSDLLFAVSLNTERRQLNVWQISKSRAISYWKPRRRLGSYEAERKRRRRSSQPGTGAATPNPRHSIGPRESYAGVQESFSARDQPKDDEDLAAQLDPAFQNPRAPGPNTRRISSMLARSDLTGNEIYTDGAVGVLPATGSRRGPSLGVAGTTNRSFRKPSGRQQPDLRGSMRSERGFPDGEDDADSTDSDGPETLDAKRQLASLLASTKGLRMDLRVRQLQSIDVDDSIQQDLGAFLCRSHSGARGKETLMLCIVSRAGGELLLFQLQAELSQLTDSSGDVMWQTRMSAVRRLENIVDACQFVDKQRSQLAILQQGSEGAYEISLHEPGAAVFRMRLPERLFVNYPYDIYGGSPFGKKRLTGPKRLIEKLATPLTALHRGAGPAELLVTDREKTAHRLLFDTHPRSHLVRDCLEICQAACQRDSLPPDAFRCCWWHICRYLENRTEAISGVEWTAFVTLILALVQPDATTPRPQTPVRSNRRKGGILRSSSGAKTDLTDFHSMIASESSPYSSMPVWMTGTAWQWAIDEQERPPINADLGFGLGLGLQAKTKKTGGEQLFKKSSFLIECLSYGQDLKASSTAAGELQSLKKSLYSSPGSGSKRQLTRLILASMHLYREELRLNLLTEGNVRRLSPLLVQLSVWLSSTMGSSHSSSIYMTEDSTLVRWIYDETPSKDDIGEDDLVLPSIFSHVAQFEEGIENSPFPSLAEICHVEATVSEKISRLLPRTETVLNLLSVARRRDSQPSRLLSIVKIDPMIVETLPEGIAAPLKSCISLQQANPDPGSSRATLRLLDRDDLIMLADDDQQVQPGAKSSQANSAHTSNRDYHAICRTAGDEQDGPTSKTDASVELDRVAVTRMIFKDDQRVREAGKLLHPLEPPVVRCVKEPEWNEQEHLEAEQDLAKVVAIRTLSVCAGRGLLLYGGRSPLLTERFPTHGFTLSAVMKPSNNTVTAEKDIFTEEKVSWAFFHAGAEAGLSISRNSKGIDTSWIVFNKPPELNNRHAGFLLALGLNGHLKNIAKWVAFKYLTPKHTMTSIGLLLGLAASYLGTMDTLIIRLLSVHVTRMLPPGAAELNLSPLTQTTGILALGLLYCETQHRRMSEIMLSEMENIEQEENDNPLETLRNEGYRLAAGFALGYINLGQGKNLRGLHDMHIVERLLALAVSTKRVDLVHVLDKASAAATVAIALIFMKSEDEALAKKIDIPDTTPQFEYVRPDLFLLRTVARHLIMWSKIQPTERWLLKQLPPVFRKAAKLASISALDIKDLPLYNTMAGICLAVGLRFAGTARIDARDLLIKQLDQLMRLSRLPALSYDHRLTRTTLRNCQDTVALAASCIMAGTGDIIVFRRLRSLHGRVDAETPYGSHMAAHQAIGTLFLAGGTHTFRTTNLAVASLLCAFYPLFPSSVLDNKGHLQAFRHLWVLATEPRCLVVRSADTHRPLATVPVTVTSLVDGATHKLQAPCLLPPLSEVARIEIADPRYWPVALDLARSPAQRRAFEKHQSLFARRRPAGAVAAQASTTIATTTTESHITQSFLLPSSNTDTSTTTQPPPSAFSLATRAIADEEEDATIAGPNTSGTTTSSTSSSVRLQTGASGSTSSPHGSLEWIFDLPALRSLSAAERSLALGPPEVPLANHAGTRASSVDDRIMLELAVRGVGVAVGGGGTGRGRRGGAGRKAGAAAAGVDRLWSLRILFAWADGVVGGGDSSGGEEGEREGEGAGGEGEDGGGSSMTKRLGWLEREVVSGLRAELGVAIAEMNDE